MDECKDCEFRGYSPQVCMLHAKHCYQTQGRERKPVSLPVKLSAKTLAGAGMGVAAVVLGSAMVSLVGGATLLHTMLLKLSLGAGVAGGGVGLYRGIVNKKSTRGKRERA